MSCLISSETEQKLYRSSACKLVALGIKGIDVCKNKMQPIKRIFSDKFVVIGWLYRRLSCWQARGCRATGCRVDNLEGAVPQAVVLTNPRVRVDKPESAVPHAVVSYRMLSCWQPRERCNTRCRADNLESAIPQAVVLTLSRVPYRRLAVVLTTSRVPYRMLSCWQPRECHTAGCRVDNFESAVPQAVV